MRWVLFSLALWILAATVWDLTHEDSPTPRVEDAMIFESGMWGNA